MSEQSIQDLIGQLASFRTRSAAADQLVAMGRDAVAPLLKALEQEGLQSAKWTVLNCLGDLGAEQAVPVIASHLERSDYGTVAHDALVKIVGRDLGPVPAEWLRWAERRAAEVGRPAGAPAEAGAAYGALSNEKLMELALEGTCVRCSEEERDRFLVDLPLAGGRDQQVTVVFDSMDHEGAEIVIIYSDCGQARAEHYEGVLRRNLRMPYGAVALRDIEGKPCFVMFNTILRHALSPIELRKSILTVGERADRVERQLSQ
ncbi:MAG: hypothetical protein KAX19_08445 [Candidatus Brocadiae bacterium]|nr:hypothetical protein [Candidatus Brocadiia bacterium]